MKCSAAGAWLFVVPSSTMQHLSLLCMPCLLHMMVLLSLTGTWLQDPLLLLYNMLHDVLYQWQISKLCVSDMSLMAAWHLDSYASKHTNPPFKSDAWLGLQFAGT
jgi:hypothetical protein